MKNYLFMMATIIALVFSGCGGGGDSSSSNGGTTDNSTSSITISGYVEDDPIPDANVTLYDNSGNIIKTAKTDDNGLYSLDTPLEKDTVYYLKVAGTLNSQAITMNSILNFDGNNTTVHANPLTELKYQLVKNDGKSIDEAENLVREYFNISKGESLEKNRFSTTDNAYIGMKNVAELYNGTLPVDAIAKIKEDIIRNASLDANQTKDFAFRNLVKKEIELSISSTSLALGENATVNVSGIDKLNKNFTLQWTGLPSDANGTHLSKTFTVNDFAQDVHIGASLYRVDGNTSTLVSSASAVVNFYKELQEQNLTVTDSSIDNNFTTGENLNITIPAGTVSSGETIKVVEQQTNSDTSIAHFSIDAGTTMDGNITFSYKYDPYLVSDPRSLQITVQTNTGPQIISADEIDYVSHIIKFDVPISGTTSRAYNNNTVVTVERIVNKPTVREVLNFTNNYKNYLEKILSKFISNDVVKTNIYNQLISNIGIGKLTKILEQKDINGDYKFNILASVINNIISYEEAQKLHDDSSGSTFVSWQGATEAYFEWKYQQNSLSTTASNIRYARFASKIVQMNKVISTWIGNAKLTSNQSNTLKTVKFAVDFLPGVANARNIGDFISLGQSAVEAGFDYYLPNELSGTEAGFTVSRLKDTQTILSAWDTTLGGVNIGLNIVDKFTTGYLKDSFFRMIENGMILNNTVKTAPIFLSLYPNYNLLPFDLENGTLVSPPMKKENFVDTFFPAQTGVDLVSQFYNENRQYILDAPILHTEGEEYDSQLSSQLDINKRLEKLFLTKYASQSDSMISMLPDNERALAYLLIRYSYGDTASGEFFKKITDAMYIKGFQILMQSIMLRDEEIGNISFNTMSSVGTTLDSISGSTLIVKSDYTITPFDRFLNFVGITRSINRANNDTLNNIKNISSYQSLMEAAKLKLTNAQLETLNIKKIKVETYGIGLQYDSTDNAWTINESDKVNDTFEATQNINDMFTYDSNLEKNVLSFATLFSNENLTQFDDKLVGLKITLVFEKDGIDKVLSSDFVFTTLSDTENLIDTSFTGATLVSNVKDAATDEPIQGAFVTVSPGGLSSLTDANGNYEVSNLAAGEYTIIISKEGYGQIEAAVTLEEDETKVYEASLSIGDDQANVNGTSTVTIKDAFSGTVLTDGYIKIRNGQNNNNGEVVQEYNSDGNSSIEVTLFPGTYTIEAGANGYTKAYTTVTILGDSNENKTISISPILSANQTRSVLSWGETPNDLDSHLVKKVAGVEQYHIYYSNRNPSNVDAKLDTDITSSYGPETVTINSIDTNAVYTYYVYNYSGGAGSVLPNSGAKVDIYFGDNLRTFYVPNEEGRYWKVFEIVNGDIVPCTSNCVADDTNNLVRNLDRNSNEFDIFKNLPAKQ